ncbi:MAG: cobalamin-dependent protein, partial [Planctomycetota bacterium]
MNVLLVSPAVPATFWSYTHVLPLLGKRAAFPPLGLLTVAAMLPRSWELRVVDLNVGGLREADLRWADYVLLSAMIVHERSVRKIAARCLALGKTIVAGGPLFTTGHERFPEIRHFVLGEAEPVIDQLITDMAAGALQATYGPGERPSLDATPPPRWDLIRLRDYATMPLQFSRGCPFDCEFCDIIAMYGRTPRTKSAEQFTRELDALWEAGWRESVFVVDDNFIGHKPRAKALLRALAVWQARHPRPLTLITEASLNLADDPEL